MKTKTADILPFPQDHGTSRALVVSQQESPAESRMDIGIPPMHPWFRNTLWFGAGVLTCYLVLR